MKKMIYAALLLTALLLCSCGAPAGTTVPSEPTAQPQQTQPAPEESSDAASETPAAPETPEPTVPASNPSSASSSSSQSSSGQSSSGQSSSGQSSSGQTQSPPPANTPKAGTLSSFSAQDLSCVTRDESIFSGYKLTMINIWATFCSPCLGEMPELGQLAEENRSRGVQIVGIVSDIYSDDDLDTARSLVAQTGASYLHLVPSADLYSAVLNQVQYVPTTVFVDSHGTVVGQTYVGAKSEADWQDIIDDLLESI
jgi:thiol-disulfide isomerase/thioredoxin